MGEVKRDLQGLPDPSLVIMGSWTLLTIFSPDEEQSDLLLEPGQWKRTGVIEWALCVDGHLTELWSLLEDSTNDRATRQSWAHIVLTWPSSLLPSDLLPELPRDQSRCSPQSLASWSTAQKGEKWTRSLGEPNGTAVSHRAKQIQLEFALFVYGIEQINT